MGRFVIGFKGIPYLLFRITSMACVFAFLWGFRLKYLSFFLLFLDGLLCLLAGGLK